MVNGMAVAVEFLSTPSARRATKAARLTSRATRDFYPRPPRGGRPRMRGGGIQSWIFLSTPSARRATHSAAVNSSTTDISIHALREEGDRASDAERMENADFYPRPPRGGRPGTPKRTARLKIHFYPRPPRGGRQDITNQVSTAQEFLSTPSARRATSPHFFVLVARRVFLSTPSARRATNDFCV